MMATFKHWLTGVRFYIAGATLLVTGLVVWWTETAYGGSSLTTIRCQETFAWLALSLMVLAISIGPTAKLFPKLPGKSILFEARRLIGVSAAWFATLHVGIAYFVQFSTANPFSLPAEYRNAFGLGVVALAILLAMAFTSFDKAFNGMGIWWFRLHRFIYVAIMLVLFHIFYDRRACFRTAGSHGNFCHSCTIISCLCGY